MTAIEVNNLSKKFEITGDEKGSRGILEKLRLSSPTKKKIWALKDVSFEVEEGEWLGIIGENGSGKSTLLKVLANVLYPTEGEVNVNGDIIPVLTLSAGFVQELTAKENVYLYGSLMGLDKDEIDRKYDEIVSFSELYDYMGTKYKKFSDGMKMRLAFSTAISIESDIFLSDEVFAVGDGDFQEKCLEKMEKFREEGRTIVFVTHNLRKVKNWCDRVMFLDEGEIKDMGPSEDIVERYREFLTWKGSNEEFRKSNRNTIEESKDVETFKLEKSNGKESYIFRSGEDIGVEIKTAKPAERLYMSIKDSISDSVKVEMLVRGHDRFLSFEKTLGALELESGEYSLSLEIDGKEVIEDVKLKIGGNSKGGSDFLVFTDSEDKLSFNDELYCFGDEENVKDMLSSGCIFAHRKVPGKGDYEDGFIARNGKIIEESLPAEEVVKRFKEGAVIRSEREKLKKHNDNVLEQHDLELELKNSEGTSPVFNQGGNFQLKIKKTEQAGQGNVSLERNGKTLLKIFSKPEEVEGGNICNFSTDNLRLPEGNYGLKFGSTDGEIINNLKIKIVEGHEDFGNYVLVSDDLDGQDFPQGTYYAFGEVENIIQRFNEGSSIPVYSIHTVDLGQIKEEFEKGKQIEGGE